MKNELEKILKEIEEIKTKEILSKQKASNFQNGIVMTFGTFDAFHIGHKKIIDHALNISGDEKN